MPNGLFFFASVRVHASLLTFFVCYLPKTLVYLGNYLRMRSKFQLTILNGSPGIPGEIPGILIFL